MRNGRLHTGARAPCTVRSRSKFTSVFYPQNPTSFRQHRKSNRDSKCRVGPIEPKLRSSYSWAICRFRLRIAHPRANRLAGFPQRRAKCDEAQTYTKYRSRESSSSRCVRVPNDFIWKALAAASPTRQKHVDCARCRIGTQRNRGTGMSFKTIRFASIAPGRIGFPPTPDG